MTGTLSVFNKKPSFTVKKFASAIGQNQSHDLGLSVTNWKDCAVMNVNLLFLDLNHIHVWCLAMQ